MLMDTDSAFETNAEASGMSSTSMFMGIGVFIVLFILVLFVINFISNKEEGTLAGIDFNALRGDDMSDDPSNAILLHDSTSGPKHSP
jgi:flagellar basal body-associated protein FliL